MRYLIYVFITAVLVSCHPVRIALPGTGWENAETWTVKGRQGLMIKQKLSFGSYATQSVKRSWTRGSDAFAGWAWGRPGYEDYSRIIGVEYSQRKQSVRFTLADADRRESHALCVTRTQSKNFVIGRNPNSLFNIGLDLLGVGGAADNLFWVSIFLKDEERPWEMILDNEAAQRYSRTYSGIIARSRDEYLTIHPIYQLQGKNGQAVSLPAGSVGFEIRSREGEPLAAVSLIDNGIVYIREKDPARRFLLANICTALLLQEQIG